MESNVSALQSARNTSAHAMAFLNGDQPIPMQTMRLSGRVYDTPVSAELRSRQGRRPTSQAPTAFVRSTQTPSRNKAVSRRDRAIFFARLLALNHNEVVLCPAAYRDILFGWYYQARFPCGIIPRGAQTPLAGSLRKLFSPTSEAAGLIIDALLLRHLGQVTSDASCIREGEIRRLAALQLARRMIARRTTAKQCKLATPVICLLNMYESETEDAEGVQAHHSHTNGLRAVLSMLEPADVMACELTRNIFATTYPLLVTQAIQTRRRTFLDHPKWFKVWNSVVPGRVGAAFAFGTSVASLMERLDTLVADKNKTQTQAMDLMTEVLRLKTLMVEWLTKWYEDDPYHLPPSCIDIIAPQLDDLRQSLGPAAMAFPSVYEMQLSLAPSYVNHYAIRLLLDTSIYTCSLLLAEPLENTVLSPSKQYQVMEDCVEELCRSVVPLLCSPLSTMTDSFARKTYYEPLVCLPTLQALKWYEDFGVSDKAEWCRMVLKMILSQQKFDVTVAQRSLLPKWAVAWTLLLENMW